MIYYVGLISSKYTKIFLDNDESGFFSHTIYAVGLISAEVFVSISILNVYVLCFNEGKF